MKEKKEERKKNGREEREPRRGKEKKGKGRGKEKRGKGRGGTAADNSTEAHRRAADPRWCESNHG